MFLFNVEVKNAGISSEHTWGLFGVFPFALCGILFGVYFVIGWLFGWVLEGFFFVFLFVLLYQLCVYMER